jgi:hypothetical protein
MHAMRAMPMKANSSDLYASILMIIMHEGKAKQSKAIDYCMKGLRLNQRFYL